MYEFQSLIGLILTYGGDCLIDLLAIFQSLIGLILTEKHEQKMIHIAPISIPYRSYSN